MQEQQMITSGDLTLKELVLEQKYLFRVSNYQRHYVWTEKEVHQFLSDGMFCWRQKQEGNYFMHFAGLMSLRVISEERDKRQKVEIVDGQQRLTTFMLLVVVGAQIIEKECEQKAKSEELWKEYLVSSTTFGTDMERLELSPRDQELWKKLRRDYRNNSLSPSTESHKHLLAAAEVIDTYFRGFIEGQNKEEAAESIKNYVNTVASSFRFVILTTTHPGYAYALYQIVNDRGVPLTSGELLKARTIELLSDKKELAEKAEEIWDDILQDPGIVTNRYLSWNYTAVTGKKMETRRGETIHGQYERDIFNCYGKRILSETEQLQIEKQLRLLEVNVLRMRVLDKGALPEAASQYTKTLYEALITVLKNTSSIPLYLKILEMNEKQAVRTLNTITPMLAKNFFMAKTIGGLHDNVITNCYLEIWKCIDSNHADIKEIEACFEKLLKRDNCKKEFLSRIKDDVYVRGASGNSKAKFLLIMLELHYLKKVENGGCECGDDSFRIHLSEVSVEHILKESVNPDEISKAFYNGIHKIGNLTLAGKNVNSRMKNAEFEEKRKWYQISPYCITREVGQLTQWKKAEFDARQDKMLKELKEVFQL